MLTALWRFLFGPRASASELDSLRSELDALGRQLADLPNREDLARQKAAWAAFLVDYEGIADKVEVNLKRLGARMGRAGLAWDGEKRAEADEPILMSRKYGGVDRVG